MTRLTKAARNGEKEKVKEFIQAGDNVDEKNKVYNDFLRDPLINNVERYVGLLKWGKSINFGT